MFIDRLIESITEKRNPSVVGLDTLLGYVPRSIREKHAARLADPAAAAAEAIFEFNARIIDRVCDIVPAVKPQLAYFELYGPGGAECFRKTADYARAKGLLVIADAKRNDIGSTATAYADAYLGETELGGGEAMRALGAGAMDASPKPGGGDAMRAYAADAMTVNPYLGADGVEPFLKNCDKYGKGIFVLVKTSNPSSGQLQDLELKNGLKVYEQVAELVDGWADGRQGAYGFSSVGAVVGATYPEQARELRKILKRAYFLVPGFGAQGGTAEGAAAAFCESGLGAVVNASRSVLTAWRHERWEGKYAEDDFAEAARAEALRMKAELNAAIGANG